MWLCSRRGDWPGDAGQRPSIPLLVSTRCLTTLPRLDPWSTMDVLQASRPTKIAQYKNRSATPCNLGANYGRCSYACINSTNYSQSKAARGIVVPINILSAASVSPPNATLALETGFFPLCLADSVQLGATLMSRLLTATPYNTTSSYHTRVVLTYLTSSPLSY